MPGIAALFDTRRHRGLWQALLLLLSLALIGQSIAVQAHRHAPAPTCVANPVKSHAKPHAADHCALCQEARLSGHYLLTDAPIVALALLATFLLLAVRATPQPGLAAPIPWRSRAPPSLPVRTPQPAF
ncbi:MAG: hypothetical protein KGN34_09550 [Sphingomonadales bacterium]|nr:hypothetical protein [Sphingomonadales bacterium]